VTGYSGPIARYGDDVWPLTPLSDNPSFCDQSIHWDSFPVGIREELRLIAWTMINGALPHTFLRGRAVTWRSRLGASQIYKTTLAWRGLATWLGRRPLAGLSGQTLGDYATVLKDGGLARNTMGSRLTALTRLWAFDQISLAPLGIGEPPWEREGQDDYLPAATAAGENATDPVTEATMGPLLIWAMRVVDDFAEDILATWRERQRTAHVRRNPGPCPLATPITGLVDGTPWREFITYDEAADLMRILGTACFVVIAYLTGMRPGEVLGLRTGCCRDSDSGRHLIHGHTYKHARDEKGHHLSAGELRDVPWVAILPVVNAIRVLERIVPEGALLFDSVTHGLGHHRAGTGSLTSSTLRGRIEDFATWGNAEADRLGRPDDVIPPDPRGAIGTARFRRTLAWHIARRPGGLVALAIQYGHMRTAVSAGYASRSRDGIHQLLDMETALATIDTVANLHDRLEAGDGISGPAARRAINAAAQAPRFQGVAITNSTARKVLTSPDLAVHDNPHAMLTCVFKREKALCHREGTKDTPSLDRCVSTCANIARTDHQADQLQQRATELETKARHVPHELARRLRMNADRLREAADRHHHDRITLKDTAQ
jgi:integrase